MELGAEEDFAWPTAARVIRLSGVAVANGPVSNVR